MPKGVYERTHKTTKSEIMDFVKFCFREDIAKQLERVREPEKLAVDLYEQETGKHIKLSTAKQQNGKWTMINGVIYRT